MIKKDENIWQVCCRLTLPSFFGDSSQGGSGVKTGGEGEEQTVGNFGENLSNQEDGGVKIEGSGWEFKEEIVGGYNPSEQPNDYGQDGIHREEREKETERKDSGVKPTDSLSNSDKAEATGDRWSWI